MDHAAKALSRVYWQYRNSPRLKQWLRILPRIAQANLETPLDRIINLLDIDTATGDQLDIIARIAGIDSRPRMTDEGLSYFGYAGTPNASAYGTAPYIGPGQQVASFPIPDYLFRIVVRAKIYQNVSVVTIDDVKQAVDFIIDDDSQVVDGQDMTIDVIWIKNELSPNLRKIIETQDLIPRPQGVRIRKLEQRPVPTDYQYYAPSFVAYRSEFDVAINKTWPAA